MKRRTIVNKHNPILTNTSTDSPLSVGNGNFCFTADITGMQTLCNEYSDANFPLCTMSNWGWHTAPTEGGRVYEWHDLELTEYNHADKTVKYPTHAKPGNEEVYHWLRHNPHKFNLGRIGLCRKNGEKIRPDEIIEPEQELELYEGMLHSSFYLDDELVEIETVCDEESDTIAFRVATQHDGLKILLEFPYGSHEISGSCWNSAEKHSTTWDGLTAIRQMDDVEYFVNLRVEGGVVQEFSHSCEVAPRLGESEIRVTFRFTQQRRCAPSFEMVEARARKMWHDFWHKVKLADFSKATKIDPRAAKLERRMVRSLYLMRIQAIGNLPPAETGLTVNSWYGRFHTEMYFWNMGWMPFWGLGEMLLPSLQWFYRIAPQAQELARSNGYGGVRWPKQPAHTGRDAPSEIAPLLVWQQPHNIHMLWAMYNFTYTTEDKKTVFLQRHWGMVKILADFMVSFLRFNETTGECEILPPVMPAQEVFDPTTVKNPMFEMEYFRFGLSIACEWGTLIGQTEDVSRWNIIRELIAKPMVSNGLYMAHANCPDTFENFNRDHPMMLGAFGMIPGEVDPEIMRATLDKVLECWQHETMWGWDYAMMAMCALRLSDSELAIDLLLSDNPKNQYVESGNNYQRGRDDLPLYLPGNGSFLLALNFLIEALPKEWGVETLTQTSR